MRDASEKTSYISFFKDTGFEITPYLGKNGKQNGKQKQAIKTIKIKNTKEKNKSKTYKKENH